MPSETEKEARGRRVEAGVSKGLGALTNESLTFQRGAEYEAPIARQAERARMLDALETIEDLYRNAGEIDRAQAIRAARLHPSVAGARTEEEE